MMAETKVSQRLMGTHWALTMVGLMWRDLQTAGCLAGLIPTGSQKADHLAAMMAWMMACLKSTAIHLAVMLANRTLRDAQTAASLACLKWMDS